MASETSVSIALENKVGESGKTTSLVGNPLKKFCPDVNIVNQRDIYTEELFEMLSDLKEDEFIEFILSFERRQTSPPNLNCSNGWYTYLQYACCFGLEKVARYLIISGADLNAVCLEGDLPPLFQAIAFNNFVIANYILDSDLNQIFVLHNDNNILHEIAKTEIEPSDELLLTLNIIFKKIHRLCVSGEIKEARCLLNEENPDGKTPLNIAIENGFDKMILTMLENGIDMFEENKRGECGISNMNPNVLEKYLNTKVTRDLISKHNFMVFDYTSIVPPEYFENDKFCEESSRIVYLSQLPELRHLIKHPVVNTLIHLKWQKVKWLFYFNLLFYVIFCCLFTRHILVHKESQTWYLKTLVVLCIFIIAARELLQAYMSPLAYIRQLDNWIEIFLVLATLLTMFSNTSMHQQISSVAIFLTWIELILLMGRYPNLSTKVEMYKRVSLNFFKYLSCYSIFIVAFAFSFYILARDSNPENSPLTKILLNVTITMYDSLIRFVELSPDTLPIDDHPVIGRVYLLMFLLSIVIIMLNLLNGLAVSDTQSIIDEAQLLALISRLKFISSVEKVANIFGSKVLLMFNVTYRPMAKIKGLIFISGDKMEPGVLKMARNLKKKGSREASEVKLNEMLITVENINKLVDKSAKENKILIDTLKILLDRIDNIDQTLAPVKSIITQFERNSS